MLLFFPFMISRYSTVASKWCNKLIKALHVAITPFVTNGTYRYTTYHNCKRSKCRTSWIQRDLRFPRLGNAHGLRSVISLL